MYHQRIDIALRSRGYDAGWWDGFSVGLLLLAALALIVLISYSVSRKS